MRPRMFKPGELIVFCKTKHSQHPGPRAKDVHPAPLGEDYTYQVNKFWVVVEQVGGNGVLVRTRRGKEHILAADHPNLRHANLWERLIYRSRFPDLDELRAATEVAGQSTASNMPIGT